MAHPGILAAVLLAVLAVPLLALSRGSGSGSKNVAVVQAPKSVLAHDSHATSTSAAGSTTAAPATAAPATSTAPSAVPVSAAPVAAAAHPAQAVLQRVAATTAPSTTAAAPSSSAARPAATTAPRPTATTAPRPAPTAAPRPAAAPASSQSGQGTWYRYKSGGCANNNLPMGTVVHVTNTATGATATCVVNDRGAFGYPTILDMDASVFQQLAPLGAGRISIRISW
jgi:hypothetical protein